MTIYYECPKCGYMYSKFNGCGCLKKPLEWKEHIKLPRLEIEKHNWTLEEQIEKMMEELKEVEEALTKGDYYEAGKEAFDFIQTGATLLYMLEAIGVDLDVILTEHMDKLKRRGYLSVSTNKADG